MSDSFVTPCTVAHQLRLSMGFPRQEYWSGLPFSSPGDLSNPVIKPASPALSGTFFTIEPWGKPLLSIYLPNLGFPGGNSGKEPACQCRRHKRHRIDPWVGRIPGEGNGNPTPASLPGEFHRQSSLVGYGHGVAQSWTWLKQLSTHPKSFF